MTRWEQFFQEDERALSVPPSYSVRNAVGVFSKRNKHNILDLGCGLGRDYFYLAENGFFVIGVDLAESGLMIAKQIGKSKGIATILVKSDAKSLPFPDKSFEGVYCFGLLHEFTGETKDNDIRKVMSEIYRILKFSGVLVLAVLSGEPVEGLPDVYLFTEQMFDNYTRSFQLVDKRQFNDIGCTGKKDYRVWYGIFTKQ